MALRLVEIVLPEQYREQAARVQELLEGQPVLGVWHEEMTEGQFLVKVLVEAEEAEAVLDPLEKLFSKAEGFRMILLPVEATIPRPEEPEQEPEEEQAPATEHAPHPMIGRVSREELYTRVVETVRLSRVFAIMIVLSSVVAALGILRNNVAVVIGAMVIAPLLGPNVALSLATTLADIDLARQAFKAALGGVFIALAVSIMLGLFLEVDPGTPEVASRTTVGLGDVALALASGVAGGLAFTTVVPTVLVGVMVAVALLPPLVTFGLLIGSGQGSLALGAMLLFLTNLICVNLAGVLTFLLQGVRPLSWWEAERARKATRVAIALWLLLLAALVAFIVLSQRID